MQWSFDVVGEVACTELRRKSFQGEPVREGRSISFTGWQECSGPVNLLEALYVGNGRWQFQKTIMKICSQILNCETLKFTKLWWSLDHGHR